MHFMSDALRGSSLPCAQMMSAIDMIFCSLWEGSSSGVGGKEVPFGWVSGGSRCSLSFRSIELADELRFLTLDNGFASHASSA